MATKKFWDLKIKLNVRETAGKINVDLLRSCLMDMASIIETQQEKIEAFASGLVAAEAKTAELEGRIAKLESKVASLKKAATAE